MGCSNPHPHCQVTWTDIWWIIDNISLCKHNSLQYAIFWVSKLHGYEDLMLTVGLGQFLLAQWPGYQTPDTESVLRQTPGAHAGGLREEGTPEQGLFMHSSIFYWVPPHTLVSIYWKVITLSLIRRESFVFPLNTTSRTRCSAGNFEWFL